MTTSIYIKNDILEILKTIHENIYLKLENKFMYVFLCGGNCAEGQSHIRDDIRDLLHRQEKENIVVLYPEDLFFENKTKTIFPKKDLLELETVLANNSDVVCIICESLGSASELGAFTNRSDNSLLNKVVSVVYKKFETDSSFINDGPIKRIKNLNKEKACIYDCDNKDKSKLCSDLVKVFKNIKKSSGNEIIITEGSTLSSFLSLASFCLLIIYFLRPVSSKELGVYLESFLNDINVKYESDTRGLEFYQRIAINYLYHNKYIVYESEEKHNYVLTQKGSEYVQKHLASGNFNKTDLKRTDNTRLTSLYRNLYTNKKRKGDYAS